MNAPLKDRLAFLARVVEKELNHLQYTDAKIFVEPFCIARAEQLLVDAEFAEQVEAFVSRFARLQDTLADKMLPMLLEYSGEPLGPVISNLDKAEKFAWVDDVDEWLVMRQLRNQMVHEYIEDLNLLSDSLNNGHTFVAKLEQASVAMLAHADSLLKR